MNRTVMESTKRNNETLILGAAAFLAGLLAATMLIAILTTSLTNEAERRAEGYRLAYEHVLSELEMTRETLRLTENYSKALKRRVGE